MFATAIPSYAATITRNGNCLFRPRYSLWRRQLCWSSFESFDRLDNTIYRIRITSDCKVISKPMSPTHSIVGWALPTTLVYIESQGSTNESIALYGSRVIDSLYSLKSMRWTMPTLQLHFMNTLTNLLAASTYNSYSYAYPHKTAYRPLEPSMNLSSSLGRRNAKRHCFSICISLFVRCAADSVTCLRRPMPLKIW